MRRGIPARCLTSTCTAASYLIGKDGYCQKCSHRRSSVKPEESRGPRYRSSSSGRLSRPIGTLEQRDRSPAHPTFSRTNRTDSLRSSSLGRAGADDKSSPNYLVSSPLVKSRRSDLPSRTKYSRSMSGPVGHIGMPPSRSPVRSASPARSLGTNNQTPSRLFVKSSSGPTGGGRAPPTSYSPLNYGAGVPSGVSAWSPGGVPKPKPRLMKPYEQAAAAPQTEKSQSEKPPGVSCQSPGCVSSLYLVQQNGYCTACNENRVSSSRRCSISPHVARAAAPAEQKSTSFTQSAATAMPLGAPPPLPPPQTFVDAHKGTAFAGRLEFIVSPKVKAMSRASIEPSSELVDYQLLRLKFLLNKAVGQNVHPVEVFEHFDTDGNGSIDSNEFINGLERLGIHLAQAEYMALLNRFVALDGTIKFHRFKEVLGIQEKTEATDSSASSKEAAEAAADAEVDEILRSIHREIQQLASRGAGKPDFKKVFQMIDKDGGGEIVMTEFMVGLSEMGIDLKARQMSQVSKVFDADGAGTIDYEEFTKFCEAKDETEAVKVSRAYVAKKKKAASKSKFTESELHDMVQSIHQEINRLARSKGRTPNFKAMFAELDRDGGGEVDISEFLEGLGNMGFELSLKQSVQVAKVFDADGTGLIAFEEFVAFCEAKDVTEAINIGKALKMKKKKVPKKNKARAVKKEAKPVDNTAILATAQSIHKELNRLAKGRNGTPNFRKIFSEMDSDGGGKVDVTEFLDGLAGFGFILRLKQVAQVAAIFDTDGEGSVDYNEFVQFCEAKDAEEALALREKKLKKKKK